MKTEHRTRCVMDTTDPEIKFDENVTSKDYLNKSFKCPICRGHSETTINTYKHYWISCNDCGNVFRQRKTKYFIPRILPNFISNRIPTRIKRHFFPMKEVIEDESKFYDYYSDASSRGNAKGTKWEGQLNGIKERLGRCGVDLRGKKILDISGGPGFVVKELEGVAKRAVVTEFSQISVDGMKKNLGVEAVKFDYNKDKLHEVIKDKFDIVLINYSINFCLDLKAFVSSLRKVVHDGSVVMVSFVPPTLGCCLRWQHDEYTYNILYHPETVARVFAEGGFDLSCRDSDGSYYYMANRRFIFFLFTIPYRIVARRRHMNINRELIQKNMVYIFKVNEKSK